MSTMLARATRLLTGAVVAAAGLLTGSLVLAEPLVLRVNPHLADHGVLMQGGTMGIPAALPTHPRTMNWTQRAARAWGSRTLASRMVDTLPLSLSDNIIRGSGVRMNAASAIP
ncbi:hypothetical protein [Heyndrickxia sporothermodurans]